MADEYVSRDFDYVATVISDDATIELKQVQCKIIDIELLRDDHSVRHFGRKPAITAGQFW